MNIFKILCCRKTIPFVGILIIVAACSVIITCIAIISIGIDKLKWASSNQISKNLEDSSIHSKPDQNYLYSSVWLKSKTRRSSHLKHVVNAFKSFNYQILDLIDGETPNGSWNFLWSHNYPFRELRSHLFSRKTTCCINHYPGSGFITNKVHLAASGIEFIPKAFKVPQDKYNFLKFAQDNPNSMFVQKSSDHRGIKIKNINELKFDDKSSFIQQFIHNPLLVDGHKFDIGVYTVVTSVNPLRVYIFKDVLFRFCTEKYHPFLSNDSRKYVVGDDYLPTWNVPSLKHFYNVQKLGMKGSFDLWLRKQNKNPDLVWAQVEESIRKVFYFNEDNIIKYAKQYPSFINFFELMRFDFIIDENLKVYLMEANMSPNLSSAHFKQNRLLYEQVVYHLLSLVGVGYNFCSGSLSQDEKEMRCSFKDVAVFPEHCSTFCTESTDCEKVGCQLCHPCLNKDQFRKICKAFMEHNWKGSYKRVLPLPTNKSTSASPGKLDELSHQNTLMSEWFRGKCLLDTAFCS